MHQPVIESLYPLTFRKKDASLLGEHIRLRHSVELVGVKRVGISNFLRFFLYHPQIVKIYIGQKNHLFIPVDLNDLIEREIVPFWTLTFKRMVDVVEKSTLDPTIKQAISSRFLASIQAQDHFLTMENIRSSLIEMVNAGFFPTLFLLRFDRIQEAVTPEFFDNLQGLLDATGQNMSYVFTSFRPLDQIAPVVFPRKSLSGFSHIMYLTSASKKDMQIILETLQKRYSLNLSPKTETTMLDLAGGHVQYLHFFLVVLHELGKDIKSTEELISMLEQDERITLQSEEIWESLYKEEQAVLTKVLNKKAITQKEKEEAMYLWNTGILTSDNEFSSPLFRSYVQKRTDFVEEETIEFSKKEYLLFNLLKEHINSVCDRDTIIARVWQEYEETDVSDWTIDRLIARLRNKLKQQKSPYSIITIRTRGYKLVRSAE